MSGIYRGTGGTGDSTTDATITAVTQQAANAAASATAASTSASAASSSATSASTSETNAAASAAGVAASAASALASEVAAAASEGESAASETAASLSETNSGTSETNAATSASQSASSAANSLSSKNAASGSEVNAATSATAAASSASTATTQATTATTKAAEALASKTASAASETSAATSATTATTQATTATTKASEASQSAVAAASSESTVAASATAAALSETNAGVYSATAVTKASEAATSETNAATSATTALNSLAASASNAAAAAVSATAAQVAETAAELAEVNAETAETAAELAETHAETAEAAALVSQSAAAASQSSATASASSAAASASSSSSSATDAQSSEDDAATSETNAANSASASSTSAVASSTSASNSASSATSASTSAATAITKASIATTKATEASTSASNAATSASAAATSETNAASSASASATSATASSNSASSSAGSASTASTQAGIATTQATTATTKASQASTSESNAASSATASATSAGQSSTSATSAATSATSAAASLASFTGQYVSQPTAPSSPSLGDLWFDETNDIFKVYTASGFVEINSSVNGVEEAIEFVATSGQTTYSMDYDVGNIQVYLNGIRLDEADYTATNGTSVVLDVGATLGDTVFMQAFGVFQLADVYNKAVSDSRYAAATQVLTNVPSGALFTDTNTVYTHPTNHAISVITGLQTALNGKVDDSQVLTNVPSGAVFTDTNTTYSVGDGGLTTNDFTDADHTKLNGIATGANNYTLPSGLATETYVGTQISNLVDSSPATLNTLNELAAALGDDPNFATTVANSIAGKVDDSQVLTNVPAGAVFTDTNTTYIVGDGGLTQVNFTTADHTKLNGIATSANNYSFPYTISSTAGNNTVVLRHPSGYINANYFNGTGTFNAGGNTSGMAVFTGANGTDTYGRSYTAAAARTLLNVENGATADQTAAEILTKVKTVDGAGSGLDADLLDGQQASAFLGVSATASKANKLTAGGTGPSTENLNTVADSVDTGQLEYRGFSQSSSNAPPVSDNANGVISVGQHSGNYGAQIAFSSNGSMYWRDNPGASFGSWRKMYDSGNDGSGSGLDADLLDGNHASAFLTPTGDGSQLTGLSGFSFPTQASLSTGTIVQSVNTTYQSLYLGSGGAGWYYFQDFTTGCRLLNVSGWTNDSSDSNGVIPHAGHDLAGIFYCTGTPRLYSLKWGSNNNIYTGGSIKWVKIG